MHVIVAVQLLLYDALHPVTRGVVHLDRLSRVFLMAFLGGGISMLLMTFMNHFVVGTLAAPVVKRGVAHSDIEVFSPSGHRDSDPPLCVLECSVGEELGYLLHDLWYYRSDLSMAKREKFNGMCSNLSICVTGPYILC